MQRVDRGRGDRELEQGQRVERGSVDEGTKTEGG
jgi:hypothetical protein